MPSGHREGVASMISMKHAGASLLLVAILSLLCCARAAIAGTYAWGYIDRTGKFVIKPRFADADYFSEGLAPVMINDRWG